MVILVKLFGMLAAAAGIIFTLKPDILKRYIEFWKRIKRLRIGGIISILFGIIFLMAASQCKWVLFIQVLGIWAIIKGVLLLTLGEKVMNSYFAYWENKPASVIRYFSLIIIAIGVLVLYAV
ncbi:MAG: hypothetical protein ABH862_01460 [Candidatus Omnitrophota bacterium]